VAPEVLLATSSLTFGAKTVLVYENQTGPECHEFVLRIARFQPDIFLEWESFNHQGTIHLRKKAVADARKLTVGGLFEAGVDVESKDVMTNWLSTALYYTLIDGGQAQVQLNRRKIKMTVIGEGTRQLVLNQVEIEVPVVRIKDNQNGSWVVHKNPRNPVLIEYQSPHYHMQLKRISTHTSNNLRWIRKLPPVK
jgi:hypothetical protein